MLFSKYILYVYVFIYMHNKYTQEQYIFIILNDMLNWIFYQV